MNSVQQPILEISRYFKLVMTYAILRIVNRNICVKRCFSPLSPRNILWSRKYPVKDVHREDIRRMATIPVQDFPTACSPSSNPRGLVLGMYCDDNDKKGLGMKFTPSAEKYNQFVNGKLMTMLKMALPLPKLGQVRVFYGLEKTFSSVVVVGMGQDCLGYNPKEEMDEQKETIRMAAAAGARALQDLELPTIYVDNFCHAESAAEGAAMGLWVYQKDKKESMQKPIPKIELYDSPDWVGWQVGLQKASAQNLARQLMETPANLLTPTAFSLSALEVLTKSGVNVELKVRNWAKLRNFNAFLAVANGSCQPPIFLEASYEGCDPDIPPIVLIGKGVTFDAGGISGKSAEDMKHTRGDMGGAATVVAAMRAVSTLQIPINVRGLIPLCENLLGTCAYKPGEIITAHNGKSILVQDTSNEGRLMLADALSYSAIYNPKFIVDVGTLTKDVAEVFGTTAAGVFTNSDSLYDLLRIASIHTGDRIWRFPLWENYSEEVTGSERSDVINVGSTEYGGACNAAAFLRQFVPAGRDWLHIDCCGILRSSGRYQTYLREGMSGRPTRTLVEFLSQFACRE